ncbi:MAG TPA: PqqD family peptide modification chaperone [Thermoanaerobaculia bacterium]
MKVSPDSIVVVSKDQMASDVAGETVILGLTAGRYYGLDAVGARVWQVIQTPTPFADLRRTIVSEYDVEPERCEADLLTLLQKMADAGLVEVRSAGAP